MGKPPGRGLAVAAALLEVTRRTNAALTAISGARTAVSELAKLGRKSGTAGQHFKRAEAAVRRGISALGDGIPRAQYGKMRDHHDPLLRCKHCEALVFRYALFDHMPAFHNVTVPREQLELHFEVLDPKDES